MSHKSLSWVHEHRFPDSLALAHALSGEIKVDLEEAIQERGAASLVVSGGRTPARLFVKGREPVDVPPGSRLDDRLPRPKT